MCVSKERDRRTEQAVERFSRGRMLSLSPEVALFLWVFGEDELSAIEREVVDLSTSNASRAD